MKKIGPPSRELALAMLDWHGGQNDPIYAVGSSWLAGRSVPSNLVEDAISNLVRDLSKAKRDRRRKDAKELTNLVAEITAHWVDEA